MRQEISIMNFTTTVSIKFFKELFTFFFWNLKTKINESPSEIINVQLMASIIHSCKNFAEISKPNPWSGRNSSFKILANIIGINFGEIFNLSSILSIWWSVYNENIVWILEFSWYINCASSLLFHFKVLWFIQSRMIVTVDLVFGSKIILNFAGRVWA